MKRRNQVRYSLSVPSVCTARNIILCMYHIPKCTCVMSWRFVSQHFLEWCVVLVIYNRVMGWFCFIVLIFMMRNQLHGICFVDVVFSFALLQRLQSAPDLLQASLVAQLPSDRRRQSADIPEQTKVQPPQWTLFISLISSSLLAVSD